MMRPRSVFSWAVSLCPALLVPTCYLGAQDVQPSDLVPTVQERERRIHTVHARIIAKDTKDGNVFMEGEWAYDRGRECIKGREFYTNAYNLNTGEETHLTPPNNWSDRWVSFGGRHMRALIHGAEELYPSAAISPLNPSAFTEMVTPHIVMGYGLDPESRRSLGELLRDAPKVEVHSEMELVDGRSCLVVDAHSAVVMAEYNPPNYDLRVWLDPERDYRLLKAELYKAVEGPNRFKSLWRRIDQVELERVNSVWFPVHGRWQSFSSEALRPGDITEDAWIQLTPLKRLETATGFKVVPYVGHELIVDRNALTINEAVPEVLFDVPFPPEARVYDHFKKEGYWQGGKRPPKAEEFLREAEKRAVEEAQAKAGAWSWLPYLGRTLFVGVGAILLIVAGVTLWRRRRWAG